MGMQQEYLNNLADGELYEAFKIIEDISHTGLSPYGIVKEIQEELHNKFNQSYDVSWVKLAITYEISKRWFMNYKELSVMADKIYNIYLDEYHKTNNKHVMISRKSLSNKLGIQEADINDYIDELVNKFLLTPSYCGRDKDFIHCTLNINEMKVK